MRRFLMMSMLLTVAGSVSAQVTLTSIDMFYAPNQYYRMYSNTGDVSVSSGIYGNPDTSNPQFWDFTTGPENKILDYDYILPQDSGHDDDFPQATLVEHKVDSSAAGESWMFLDQTFGVGRTNYGFYDEGFSSVMPAGVFNPPILDFPDPMQIGSNWTVTTSFYTQLYSMGAWLNVRIDYNASSVVDAFGIMNLPQLGFANGLRVNELATYDAYVDMFGDGTYYYMSTDYIRTYYFLMEDHGIVSQISSLQMDHDPGNNFTTASIYVRMFETNHPTGELPPEPVTDLQITPGSGMNLLFWSPTAGAAEYRVEYCSDPLFDGTVYTLGTTESDYMLDSAISGVTRRFYRVIALN